MTEKPLPTTEDILSLLAGVVDPELGCDIVELGMARDVAVESDGTVRVTVALTTAGCPLKAQIKRDVTARLESTPGVTDVVIDWTEMDDEQRAHAMSRARWHAKERAPDTEIPPTARIVGVASGKGGVGKSSVTVNLAVGLAGEGFTVGVLDADIGGFSVPRMLGLEGRLGGVEGEKKITPHELPIGGGLLKVVSMGFLVDDEETALLWRGQVLQRAVQHFLEDVRWGDLDYLLIDLPPGTGDIQMGLARLLPRAEMIIVTTPAVGAQKVAARAADLARKTYLRVAGVVENMSAFTCDHGESYPLFGTGGGQKLADDIGAPLLGQIPLEPGVSTGGDAGRPAALGEGPAADAFAALVRCIVDEAIPPVAMGGCTARILDNVEAALGPAPAQPV
ncbi:MAG: Mrp/NBP35 family ATP-binding protein [Acidimicrobiales bacterium]